MSSGNQGQRAIEVAEAEVEYWREQARVAKERADRELEKFQQALDNFKTAAEFHRLLQQRYGEHAVSAPSQVFTGMGLRDAALLVIKQKGRATVDEIIAEVRGGGFEFKEHPRRQLHFALLKADKVRKAGAGIWVWVGPEEPQLPPAPRPDEGM